MITHSVYIVPETGGPAVKREVIFLEELEAVVRPLIIELTVCREAFRFDAKQYRRAKRDTRAEMCEERAERVAAVLKDAPSPILGRGLDALLPEVK
jgi:hypothetical protein